MLLFTSTHAGGSVVCRWFWQPLTRTTFCLSANTNSTQIFKKRKKKALILKPQQSIFSLWHMVHRRKTCICVCVWEMTIHSNRHVLGYFSNSLAGCKHVTTASHHMQTLQHVLGWKGSSDRRWTDGSQLFPSNPLPCCVMAHWGAQILPRSQSKTLPPHMAIVSLFRWSKSSMRHVERSKCHKWKASSSSACQLSQAASAKHILYTDSGFILISLSLSLPLSSTNYRYSRCYDFYSRFILSLHIWHHTYSQTYHFHDQSPESDSNTQSQFQSMQQQQKMGMCQIHNGPNTKRCIFAS